MSKQKKFKGNNAQLVGETRLTKREMKKMQAAYYNVQRDFTMKNLAEADNAARTTEDIVPATIDGMV